MERCGACGHWITRLPDGEAVMTDGTVVARVVFRDEISRGEHTPGRCAQLQNSAAMLAPGGRHRPAKYEWPGPRPLRPRRP